MNINSGESNKIKLIATTVSITLLSLLFIFLLLYSILLPNDNVVKENNNIEIGFSSLEQTSEITQNFNSENNSTAPEKVEFKNKSTVAVLANNNKTSAELLRTKFFENKRKISEGINENQNNENIGDSKSVDTKNTNGLKPEEGLVNEHITINLIGRKIAFPPTLSKDTKEEGKVVVEIIVDKLGRVIKADPNGRGTTTSNGVLKEKAKQTALTTQFSISNLEEQKGTITIIFSF